MSGPRAPAEPRGHLAVTWVALLIAGCTTTSVEAPGTWFTCTRSNDCVAMAPDCCVGFFAVRVDSVEAYNRFLCPESCPAGCLCACFGFSQQSAACVAGLCTLTAPTRAERACGADSECAEVPARCGDCDDGANYCYVHANVALREDAVAAFEDRLCSPSEALCGDLPTHPGSGLRPRCLDGQCEMGFPDP